MGDVLMKSYLDCLHLKSNTKKLETVFFFQQIFFRFCSRQESVDDSSSYEEKEDLLFKRLLTKRKQIEVECRELRKFPASSTRFLQTILATWRISLSICLSL